MANETDQKQRHSWRLHPSLMLEQVGAVEHYYEQQAAKGLVLESVGGWFDCFVRTEPCAMRYRAEPVLSGEQDGPDWDRQQFYKDAGWQYLGTAADLHFFASLRTATPWSCTPTRRTLRRPCAGSGGTVFGIH